MRALRDRSGMRFSKLTVICHDEARSIPGREYVIVMCDCGVEKSTRLDGLVSGATKTCGCGKKLHSLRHGHNKIGIRSSEYASWDCMVQRCTNPKHPVFNHYGGRGVSVCKEWMVFDNFLASMGKKPFVGASVERLDNSSGYSPANCVWATHAQQMANTRRSLRVTIGGCTRCVSEWAEVYGINRGTVYSRLGLGWEPVKALTTPARIRRV